MKSRIKNTVLLLIILLGLIPIGSVAAESPVEGSLDESLALLFASRSILLNEVDLEEANRAQGALMSVSMQDSNAGNEALAHLIHATKQQRNELNDSYRTLRAAYRAEGKNCELEILDNYHKAEEAKLNLRLGFLHKLRGDRRKLFTRMWHSLKRSGNRIWTAVGPIGRRILRNVGSEAAEVVLSGGTLSGGVIRKLVINQARNVGKAELNRLMERGVGRFMQSQAAFAVAAGVGECTPENLQAARKDVQDGFSEKDTEDQSDYGDDCDPSNSWMNVEFWENEVFPQLVNEGKGCSNTSAYKGCLEQRAAEGFCEVDAFAACETVYDTLIPTRSGQSVHIVDNEVYFRDNDNHFEISFPLSGGPVSGSIVIEYMEDKGGGDYCQVNTTFSFTGTYDPNTCLLSGTGVKTLSWKENRSNICVGYPEPYDDQTLNWSMKINNGVLNTGAPEPALNISETYGVQNYLK